MGVMKRSLIGLLVMLAWSVSSERVMAEGTVVGSVFEQDGFTPIANATVFFTGVSSEGDTVDYQFVSDSLGLYFGMVTEGSFFAWAIADGYDASEWLQVVVNDGETAFGIDFVLHETYASVHYVIARQFDPSRVELIWSMHSTEMVENFESGDFNAFNWNNEISDFPWQITATEPFEGSYCMKSGCEGVASGISEIEVVVNVPANGQMSFWQRISSESTWDIGRFYLDDVVMEECSGNSSWEEVSFEILEGVHVFRWSYVKDADNDLYDDCYYVDNICFMDADASMRSLQYFNVYRRRFDEVPEMLASHLADSSFMDMSWNHLPWGSYAYGVSCTYEGNRMESEIVWSNTLGKDLTTTLEIAVTTNTGQVAEGTAITIAPADTLGDVYNALADENGTCLFGSIARGAYWVRAQLDGYEVFASDTLVTVYEPTVLNIELQERIFDLDSLYVSSTGWAMFALADSLLPYVQHFEVMLDSVVVDTTSQMFYQFEVDTLSAYHVHHAMARPVFFSGTGAWSECDWVYWYCSDFPVSTDLEVKETGGDALRLEWTAPDNDSLIGFAVFRDNAFIGFAETASFLDETPEFHDNQVQYCVRAVYDVDMVNGYYSMACASCAVYYLPELCDPTVDLDGQNYFNDDSDYGALISWGIRPIVVNEWLFYDNDAYEMALGADGQIFWGVKFEAEDLLDYYGSFLSKVALYDIAAGFYQLWIYYGEEISPINLVYYQNMHLDGCNDWHVEPINTPLLLPENAAVWVVIGQQSLSFPAAACANTGNPNSRWVSVDGTTWTDLTSYNLCYSWMLRAFVTNQSKGAAPSRNTQANLVRYNVYRSYDGISYAMVGSVPAMEGVAFYQFRDLLVGNSHRLYYYQVTAYYDSDCESDPALAWDDPTKDYVIVDDAWHVEERHSGVLVYPNPSSGRVLVAGDGLVQVAVQDALGRVVLQSQAVSDELELDMSQFQNGLYLLRIATQKGIETHRVMVTH